MKIEQFIGTAEYLSHKAARIRGEDSKIPLSVHPAFLLEDKEVFSNFKSRYQSTSKLYYNGQPPFEEVLSRIRQNLHKL